MTTKTLKFHKLIDRETAEGVSQSFSLTQQITVVAMGLEDDQFVSFWLAQLTDYKPPACVCPPLGVQFPSVLGETQMLCCGEPILLTPEQPFIIIDAPLGVRLRAKLEGATPDPVLQNQVVGYYETDTHNVNDRLRGCPCGDTP